MFDRARGFLRRLTLGDEQTDQSADGANPERRVRVRYAVELSATCRTNCVAASRRSVRARDVSRTGISIVIDEALETGTLVAIELPRQAGDDSINVLAYVKHATAQHDGTWVVGCMFAEELDEVSLERFGTARTPALPGDKRRWERRPPVGGQATFQIISVADQARHSAEILNISPTGIGLNITRRVEPGSLLSLDLQGSGETKLTILGSVIYLAARGPDGWMIGCSFIRELSDDDLRHIL